MENGSGTEAMEDIMAYNDILNHVEREENTSDGIEWKFRMPIVVLNGSSECLRLY